MRDLIDIGVNLTHRSFDRDRDEVIERGVAAGVTVLVITGTSVRESEAALALARARPGRCYSTAGVHPHHAKTCDANTLDTLRRLAADPAVIAIGECGLDFNRNFSPPDVQETQFEAQLELAAEVKLPVFLHERDASARMLAILAKHRPNLAGGVVHCFTGTTAEAKRYLALDLYIGVTGWICDERRGASLVEAVRQIPLDKLMIETDAPFLVPRTLAKAPAERRNEPCFLPEVVKAIARATHKTEEEVAVATTSTARRFFGLDAA